MGGGSELSDQLLDSDVPTLASQDKLKVSPKGLPFVKCLSVLTGQNWGNPVTLSYALSQSTSFNYHKCRLLSLGDPSQESVPTLSQGSKTLVPAGLTPWRERLPA